MNYQPDLFSGQGIERAPSTRAQTLSAARAEMMATNSDTLFDAVERASAPATTIEDPSFAWPCGCHWGVHTCNPQPAYNSYDTATGRLEPLEADDPRLTARLPRNWVCSGDLDTPACDYCKANALTSDDWFSARCTCHVDCSETFNTESQAIDHYNETHHMVDHRDQLEGRLS